MRKSALSFGRGVLLGIDFGLLLVALLFAAYAWRLVPLTSVPYWLRSGVYFVSSLLGCLLIPGGLFLLAFPTLFLMIRRSRSDAQILTITIAAFMVANVLACSAIVPFVFGDYHHFGSITAREYTYHADGEWKVGVGSASRAAVFLWQCDHMGWGCSIIYSERLPTLIEQDEFHDTDVKLQVSPDGQVVELLINDEVVYQHLR